MKGNCARRAKSEKRSGMAWKRRQRGRPKPRAVATDLKSNKQALYVRA